MAQLQMDEGEKLRLTDALRHQIEELTRAKLQPGEYDALRARQSVLQNAEKLEAGLETAIGCLYGDESSNGAEAMLSQTAAALGQVARFDDALAALSQRAKELMYEVQDLSENVRARRQDLSYSEAELEQAESRIAQLQRLFRKYGADEAGLLTLCESAQQRLDQIEFSDDRLQALAQDLEAQKARLLARRQGAAGDAADSRGAGYRTASSRSCGSWICPVCSLSASLKRHSQRDGDGCGAVFDVRQRGRGLKAHEPRRLRRRAGADHAGHQECYGRAGCCPDPDL